jgi:hypothetical protein
MCYKNVPKMPQVQNNPTLKKGTCHNGNICDLASKII